MQKGLVGGVLRLGMPDRMISSMGTDHAHGPRNRLEPATPRILLRSKKKPSLADAMASIGHVSEHLLALFKEIS